MPDIVQHHVFGLEVKTSLSPEIRDYLEDTPYTFALFGPDPWFMYQPWKRRQGRGRFMHTTRTGDFLTALALQARDGSAPRELFSYLTGFLCHYALDSAAHPYIVWQTTEVWPTKRAHQDMEHALDILQLQREGVWDTPHPVTDCHFPPLTLPASMADSLNAAYQEVYGWKNALPALNRCYARFRLLYRVMEKPRSVLHGLASLIPIPRFLAYSYRKCGFLLRDVENLAHQPWHQAYARDLTSEESYPDLVEKARADAVRMIGDCYAFAHDRTLTEEELRRSLGSRSYLSGLDTSDPRNLLVRSLRPPKEKSRKADG